MLENNTWVEKYRPTEINDCILTTRAKKTLNAFVTKGEIPNLLLEGPPGIGKTTVALALTKQLGCDSIVVNSSLDRGIDMLRNDIKEFVSTVSLVDEDRKKYVILDEADYLTGTTQPALRMFMEQFSANAGFILTANYGSRIIPALHSRLTPVDMTIRREEKPKLMEAAFKRITTILKKEGVEFDKEVVGKLLINHFPDLRSLINRLQTMSMAGPITAIDDVVDDFEPLIEHMKIKDFLKVRKWAAETQMPVSEVFRRLYDKAPSLFHSESVATLIILIGEYQHKAAFVADQEINLMAFLVSVMTECVFK